jgi:bacterioferritin-associated ferredoxin
LVLIFSLKKVTLPLMLVCHCNGVTERRVRSTVRAGACTLREVARSCGAGASCGGCRPEITRILRQEAGAAAQSDDHGPAPTLFGEASSSV